MSCVAEFVYLLHDKTKIKMWMGSTETKKAVENIYAQMNLGNTDYSRFSQSKKGCKVFKIKFGKKSEILTDQSKNISVGDIKKKTKKKLWYISQESVFKYRFSRKPDKSYIIKKVLSCISVTLVINQFQL